MQQLRNDPFRLSSRLQLLPVVNSDGAYARAIEKWLYNQEFDAMVVPIPSAFRTQVLDAVTRLPSLACVLQTETLGWSSDLNSSGENEELTNHQRAFYVPVDPCQAVIAAIRFAIGEHKQIIFGDESTADFIPLTSLTADAYALRDCTLESFATAMLPAIAPIDDASQVQRIRIFGESISEALSNHSKVIALCPLAMWPWLVKELLEPTFGSDASSDLKPYGEVALSEPTAMQVDERSLLFFLSELPFTTAVHEQFRGDARKNPDDASIDYLKRLLMTARQTYKADLRDRARKISPLMLNQCMQYIRNLTLLERRLSPDFYTIVLASKQIIGDQFAIHVVEAAKQYAFDEFQELPTVRFGVSDLALPDGESYSAINRLDSPSLNWRNIDLNPRPKKDEKEKWAMQWNPHMQCSWPPEDKAIESFRTRLVDRAQQIISTDLAQSEKFSTSFLDGIDIRQTLRHWYDSQIYVKRIPPTVGRLDGCVMLFDTPADPRDYPWRATWFAEHAEESTLAFFASNYQQEMLGPGIGVATYGGAMFLYPPRVIHDIWQDEKLDFCDTLEQRLIAGTCKNAQSRQVALLSPIPPTTDWKRIAKLFGKRLVHLPLAKFSDQTIQQLRMFHVLNGRMVRSYASKFIRRV